MAGHLIHLESQVSSTQCGVNCGAVPRSLHRPRGRIRNRGQELVEFAIVLPLLLIIVFGVLDLGRLFHALITITNAAREGARYGMIFPDDITGITFVTRREAQSSGIILGPAVSTVSVSRPAGYGEMLPVRVTVTYHFQLLITGFLPNQSITLVRYAEMMVP